MNFYETIRLRRSNYSITNTSPISDERIEELLKECITYVPSAFHSQSSRAVLLLGDKHKKLWSIVKETLRAIVPADKFGPTDQKIDTFAAGYGTILFFEDMETVARLQKAFPKYADNFPTWSNQSGGMLQFAVWTALSTEGLGASLQHYNPLIDAEAAREFGVASSWKLLAQMPFGCPEGRPDPLTYKAAEDRLIIEGGKSE